MVAIFITMSTSMATVQELKVAWYLTGLVVRAQDEKLPMPNPQEIEEEVGRLKNKAAGADQLPSELLKYAAIALVRTLHWVISKIWEKKILPE